MAKGKKKSLVAWVAEQNWKDSFKYGNCLEDYIQFPRFDCKEELTDIKVRITIEQLPTKKG